MTEVYKALRRLEKQPTDYRNVDNLGEEEKLFGEAVAYIERNLPAPPKGETGFRTKAT
jgi:predicted metal-dependent hydrolase